MASALDRLFQPLDISGLIGRISQEMKRGTIVLGADCEQLSPTFVDCGVHALVAMRLLAGFVGGFSRRAGGCLRAPLRRYAGDMAVLGKGEILVGTRG